MNRDRPFATLLLLFIVLPLFLDDLPSPGAVLAGLGSPDMTIVLGATACALLAAVFVRRVRRRHVDAMS